MCRIQLSSGPTILNRCFNVAFAVSLTACTALVSAQSYPTKSIRLIVPFAPGGPVDGMARVIAPQLGTAFRQSVIVDNRPGASGMIAIEAGVRANPDGYTMLMVSSSYAGSAATLRLPYDPVNDVTPVVLLGVAAQLAAAHASAPFTTPRELIAYAKANPGKVNYGSSGTGGSVHLATELLNQLAGTKMTHVPYKGQGPALNELLGGQIQLLIGSPMVIYPHVRSSRLRGIAVTSAKRSNAMPEIPAFAETVPGYENLSWQAVLGPKALPKDIAQRWNVEMNRVLQLPRCGSGSRAIRWKSRAAHPSSSSTGSSRMSRSGRRSRGPGPSRSAAEQTRRAHHARGFTGMPPRWTQL